MRVELKRNFVLGTLTHYLLLTETHDEVSSKSWGAPVLFPIPHVGSNSP